MPERCEHREEIRWRPNRVVDGDLLMYLRAARSIAAFAGMCRGNGEDRCEAEAMDETTVTALDTLHKNNYDTSQSLQALVKGPHLMCREKKWTEDDTTRFTKGLRHLGKNFFKIRKEHLPHKDTCELVEFYYSWKKSASANNSRPNYRRHRRPLKKPIPRNNQQGQEVSSCSETAEESEDSDGGQGQANVCQGCLTTNSKDWHRGQDGQIFCSKCPLSFQKYKEDVGLEPLPLSSGPGQPATGPGQSNVQPAQEDGEITTGKHNMRTRRSNNNTSSTNGKPKEPANHNSPDLENSSSTTSCSSSASSVRDNSVKSSWKSADGLAEPNSRKPGQKPKESTSNKGRKRNILPEEEEDLKSTKKIKEGSDSESGNESSSASGPEDLSPADADSDENNQEYLSNSSRLSSPSSVEQEFKPTQSQTATPAPAPQGNPTSGPPAVKTAPAEVVNIPPISASVEVPSQASSSPKVPDQPLQPSLPPTSSPSGGGQQPSAQRAASPGLTVTPVAVTAASSFPSPLLLSSGSNSSGSIHQLKVSHHLSQLPVFRAGFTAAGQFSHSANKTTAHPSSHTSSTFSLSSPLVVPTLGRSSSSSSIAGTAIPHVEVPAPSSTVCYSANTNTFVTAAAKTTVSVTASETLVTSIASSGRTVSSGHSLSSTNSYLSNRMQEPTEEPDKKPLVALPGSYLPPPGPVPFAPYNPFYYPHPGAAHLTHYHPSVAMSIASSGGVNAPPPIPSLVPIKKEPHSPPPPLKPSDKPTDLSSQSSSLHSVHRSHSESVSKLQHGFSQSGLSSVAPQHLPPPLTLIDHRDGSGSKSSSELSRSDAFCKDNPRGLPASPHRSENHNSSVHKESRLDSNLSVLTESREIGLIGGVNSSQSAHQLPMSLSSLQDEQRSSSAAFQPYSHHLHPSVSASSSGLSSHHTAGSVLQVPQSGGPDHSHGPLAMISQMMPAVSSSSSAASSSSHHLSLRAGLVLDVDNVGKSEPMDDINVDDEEDDIRGGSTTPGPTPTVCSKEIYKSNSAVFVKVFDRGERNQCSRTDFVFRPLPESNLAKRREERVRKLTHSSSSSSVKEEKKRVETPPRATSASEGLKSSSGSSSSSSSSSHQSHGISGGYPERHTPRSFADMPALRQLHEYARPHVYAASLDDISLLRFAGQDLTRPPYSLGGLQHHPHMDPLVGYRLGMFPPGSRERLEIELERDKRERDARERDIRERELRDFELREKLKQDMELKPGLDRLLPPGASGSQLTDPSWLDLQRRMSFPPSGAGHLLPHGSPSVGGSSSHLPAVYPPVSLGNDLMARERDKLDRLDGATLSPTSAASGSTSEHLTSRMVYQYYSQRLTSEQHVFMQRAVNECYLRTKPETRPLIDPNHLIYQFSRADPLAGGPMGALPVSAANPLSVLPPGVAHHPLLVAAAAAGSRDELLQRELYSRGGPFLDPALAHQLSAQAAAHEALQRHMAMERERFGSASHLPH